MKNQIIFLFIFFCSVIQAQSLVLSELENINPTEEGNYRPRICLVEGEPLVLFTENSEDMKIFIQKKKQGQWLGEQRISPDGIEFQVGSRLGPAISSNGEIVYVAYIVESSPRKIAFQKSIDGGLTFSSFESAYDLGENHAEGIDLMVLPDGNPVIAFIHYGPQWSNAAQVVIRSYDQGSSFTDLISIDNSPCECCTPSLVGGNGAFYGVSYRDNTSDLRVFKTRISSINDADFSTPVLTDPTAWELAVCPASSSDGYLIGDTLYNTWMSSPFGLSQVYMSKTNIFGDEILEWSEVDYSDSYGSQNHPQVVGDDLLQVLAWEEYRETKKDIFGMIFQNGLSQPSFSLTQGDVLSHKEGVDLAYDANSGIYHMVYRNMSQSSVMYRSIESSLLDIDSPFSEPTFLYPNPTQNNLYFHSNIEKVLNYKIYNYLGITVQNGTSSGNISIQYLSPGNYLIELIGFSFNHRFSFVKV